MQKKIVRQSLALSAAAALSLSGAFVAGPALADASKTLEVQSESDLQSAVAKYIAEDDGTLPEEVGRFGFNDGDLYLGVTEKTDEVKKLEEKFDNVEVKVAAEYEAIEAQGAKDLVGGAGYRMKLPHSPEYVGLCSVGFPGWDSEGNQVLVTAGHCAEELDSTGNNLGEAPIVDLELPSKAAAVVGEDSSAPAGTGAPGAWVFHQYGLPGDKAPVGDAEEKQAIDFATVKVADGFSNHAKVSKWDHAKEDDLLTGAVPVTKIGNPIVGESIQKSGRTTGLTTGTVTTGVEDEMPYAAVSGRVVHGFEVSPEGETFSAQGDSGGAVFQGDTAVGVISGGNSAITWVADLKNSLEKSGKDFKLEKPDNGGDDDGKNADANAAAEGDKDGKDADANAAAEGDKDGKDADANAAAEGDKDGKNANADAAADGEDANAASDADGEDPAKPEAPEVEDQTFDEGGNIVGETAPNATVDLTWAPAKKDQSGISAQATPAKGKTSVTADAEGNFTAEAPAEVGEYVYTATAIVDGVKSEPTDFTVIVQAADEADAAAEGAEGADADAGADGAEADADAAADGADANAAAAADGAEASADADGSKDGEEAPAERKLTIDPKEVSAADFVQQDKGVQITAEGFDEGENVTLEVVAGPENVEGITLEETANADGVVGFSIYGTNASDPSAYLGKYDLKVTGANDTADESALTGSFSVVADEDGNGGGNNDDGNGDGDGGTDLPRTGAELTGLAAGAGLLVVGGAAVVLTMRRKRNN